MNKVDVVEMEMPVFEEPKKKMQAGKLMTFSWIMLLLGGLAHMMPDQMAPLFNWSLVGVSLQTAVGVLSVIAALYFLLEDDK